MSGKIYFIGAGPGDPELITVKGLKIIQQADVIVYAGSLVPVSMFSKAKTSRIIDSSGLTLEETHALLKNAWEEGLTAVRLHTGDPSIFGTIHEQGELLSNDNIPFEIIPGVTAAFAGAALARLSFTFPEVNQTLIITRMSGRTPVPEAQKLRELARSKSSMAIYLSAGMAGKMQDELLEAGLPGDTFAVIGWKLGWEDEEVIQTDLSGLAAAAKERGISGQAVFLIVPGHNTAHRSKLYDPEFSHGFRKQ
ncbi:precorrin-4 C(11)-methyltransferase [Desulfonatronovibrio magnus]|uniref:precorrin-4 C(11)-methyltransferase n=1 Tax=Desulfonatronovibrio magnus TaxID=698827 RepID=UPI0005EB893C|nr:precorrin-4 C(11)-methyltransferase [Desulfonatronovibrio magnus]